MKKGFTLAETLITLGIIGVVAALTIPTLSVSTKEETSLINTVASIPDVTYVVITLNGELSSVGGVPLDTPLLPDMSYLNTKS